jgi:hypothetical protein
MLRSLAMKVSALASFISLPVRTWLDLHAALVAARADAHEGDAVAVLRVHVGLDLEHEAGERASSGSTLRACRRARLRRRRMSTKRRAAPARRSC